MPWLETDPVIERKRFILEWLAWISTEESCPNMEGPRGAQVVKRSVRPFHQGTSTV